MTAARWRDVGEDLAAALGHQLAESLGLGADLVRGPGTTFITVTRHVHPSSALRIGAGQADRLAAMSERHAEVTANAPRRPYTTCTARPHDLVTGR
jgi:hypothetical protein